MKNPNPNKEKGILKVGDTVKWRGGWGRDEAKEAVVRNIDENCNGNKEGDAVDSIAWDEVNGRDVVVDLENGHWAYGDQITEIL